MNELQDNEIIENEAAQKENPQEEIAIPPEFGGDDPELAKEFMKEHGLLEDEKEEPTPEEQPESPAEQDDKAESKEEQEEGKKPGPIPYERFTEVNNRCKTLQAELAALRAAQQQQLQQNATPNEPQLPHDEKSMVKAIAQAARDQAQKALGLTDEQVEEIETGYSDAKQKNDWQTALQFYTNDAAEKVRAAMQMRMASDAQELRLRDAAYTDYRQLADHLSKQPDREAVWAYTTSDFFSGLPEHEQIMLNQSYIKMEAGQGSLQDARIVRHYLNQAIESYRGQKQSAAETKNKKIEQMKKHPRVTQMQDSGSTAAGDVTESQIRDILDSTNDPDKLPKRIRDILEGGGLVSG